MVGAPLSPRPKSCRGETFARQKWRAFLWQPRRRRRRRRRSGGGLSPSFCLPFWRTLLAPPRSRCGLAELTSRGNTYCSRAFFDERTKISEKSRRGGMKSDLVVRRDEIKCAGHSDDTRAQLCGKCGSGEERKRERRRRSPHSSHRIFKLAKELFHAHFEMGGRKNPRSSGKKCGRLGRI